MDMESDIDEKKLSVAEFIRLSEVCKTIYSKSQVYGSIIK